MREGELLKIVEDFFPQTRIATGQGSVYLVESKGHKEENAFCGDSSKASSGLT